MKHIERIFIGFNIFCTVWIPTNVLSRIKELAQIIKENISNIGKLELIVAFITTIIYLIIQFYILCYCAKETYKGLKYLDEE